MLSLAINAASLKLSAFPEASSATAALIATTLYRERSGLGGALCSPPAPDRTVRMISALCSTDSATKMLAVAFGQSEIGGASAASLQDVGRHLEHQGVVLDVHFVGARFGVDDEGVFCAEQLERPCYLLRGRAVGYAYDLASRASGIC